MKSIIKMSLSARVVYYANLTKYPHFKLYVRIFKGIHYK